jgi:hypothetical protein
MSALIDRSPLSIAPCGAGIAGAAADRNSRGASDARNPAFLTQEAVTPRVGKDEILGEAGLARVASLPAWLPDGGDVAVWRRG